MEYLYLPISALEEDETLFQFLSGVQQVLILSFPSPRLVAKSKLKSQCVALFTYGLMECLYLTISAQEEDVTSFQFLSGVQQVLILSFPSPRLVAKSRLKSQYALLFTHNWKKNSWIHTFLKSICAMWNVNSFVQDLNSGRYVYFLWW